MKKPPKTIWVCRRPSVWGDGDESPYYDTERSGMTGVGGDCNYCGERDCPGPVKYERVEK